MGAFMNDTLFNDAWVANAVFNGVQLSGANLASAHLIGTNFKNSGSAAAEFTPSIRVGNRASVSSADLSGTDFTGPTWMDWTWTRPSWRPRTGNTFHRTFTELQRGQRAGDLQLREDRVRQYHAQHNLPR